MRAGRADLSRDEWRRTMIDGPSHGNARACFDAGALAGFFLLLSVGFPAAAVAAETKNVKIMLDWIIQGTHAPYFVAQDKGYFKAAGIDVDAIDAGKGATNVAVSVAGGAYQFGWVDMPSMIPFNAQNPPPPPPP